MSTRAVAALKRQGVEFTLHRYQVVEAVGSGYGEAVAVALGALPEQVFKTLVAEVDGEVVAAVVPVAERLSLKALAAAAGGKKAEMAAPGVAERVTGYVTGGISPFGQRQRHPTFVDDTAVIFPTVFVSAGKRGLQLELSPSTLVEVAGAVLAPLT